MSGSAPGPDLHVIGQDEWADEPRTVLLTGAGGNIGGKLLLAWRDRYDVLPLDRAADPADPDRFVADLSIWDEEWVDLCDEVDVIVHLAANRDHDAAWPDLFAPNLDAVNNILLAAAQRGVERVVLASSVHVMGGYFEESEPRPITCDRVPAPVCPYGTTKLMAERLGHCVAQATGVTVIAIRVGWVLPGANEPESLPPTSWGRTLWLSNADLIDLFTRAVEADLEPGSFVLVNGVSANAGSPWSLEEAERSLGYRPMRGMAGG